MLNSFNPDQDRQNVGLDVGPKCLQRVINRRHCSIGKTWQYTVTSMYAGQFFMFLLSSVGYLFNFLGI